MNRKFVIAGVLATLIPGAALAQPPNPNCVRSNNNSRVEGTILGAGAGALIGSALAGRGSRGEGAAFGALGGAVGGNVIAGSRNDPCPPGYGYGPPPPPPGPGYGPAYGPGPARFWYGAPVGLRERFDYVQTRLERVSSAGYLSPAASRQDFAELNSIRAWDNRRRALNGGVLRPDDRAYVQSRLDHLVASVNWEARTGY